ncbi:virulence RhuM family protein, partial [Odoribacter sp. OttesenSCG-928-L07]|nr:virulence RhuM family protein [Odoribacter sp. OttesenSCG-928-L07]
MNKGEIIIYQTPDGDTNLDVRLEDETVWLSQAQMIELFDTTKQNVSLHIKNIYKEKELIEELTVKENLTVQYEGNREVARKISFYNLDVIISVGYRVKSQRGTQFRIWANKILKEYLIKGYAISQNVKFEQLNDLKKTVRILSNVIQNKELSTNEAIGLLQVISDFTYGLDILDKYDYQSLKIEQTT